MSASPVVTTIRNSAISALKAFARDLEQLVLEPQAGLTEEDLAGLTAHRDALLGLIYIGTQRQRARSLSGSTPAEMIANLAYDEQFDLAYEQFDSRNKAQDFLRRIDHHLSLLQRLYGPQVAEK